MFKKYKEALKKLDKVHSEVFKRRYIPMLMWGMETTEAKSEIELQREEIKNLGKDVKTLKELLFTYLDVEVVETKRETKDEDGDNTTIKETKLVKNNNK